MPRWELTPVNLLDTNWEAAREEAEKAFGVKTRFEPGGGIKAPPWKRPALVTAQIIQDGRYEEDGPTEILFPAL